ncbi:4244_t:CDS:1 [Paraglomus occultum]|uniref:4244_t:CDS:1 n=1 Tax=Paraglomus occultum TaxID=144539 RepID=A0A9N8ZGN1_9GLOM|nr:4244_t:CDS:1 [Paraglomus occultum]
MSEIDISEPSSTSSNTTEEITANEHKLNQIVGDFLKAFVDLGRHRETEPVFHVATLFSILENNPLDPLYQDIDRIQTNLKYVCAESPTKERVRSDLKQLVAQHLSRNPDIAVGDDTEASVERVKSDSQRPNKRPISRSETEPSKVVKKPRRRKRAHTAPPAPPDPPPPGGTLLDWHNEWNSNVAEIRGERTSSSSLLTTVDQLLPNNPNLDLTDTDYDPFCEFVSSPYTDGNP